MRCRVFVCVLVLWVMAGQAFAELNSGNCSYFIGKTPSSEFFATVLLSCSSGEMNLANKI